MRFVSEADDQERACVALDTVAVAAVQRIASPGCGTVLTLLTRTTSYSRIANAATFGQHLRPEPGGAAPAGPPRGLVGGHA